MKVFVQQPQFLPWAGFWHKVSSADVFVMYAGVQYARAEHQHRVPFLGRWLVLPVIETLGDPICKVRLDPKNVHKIGKTLTMECMNRHRPYRLRIEELVDVLLDWKGDSFLELHVTTYLKIAKILDVKTQLVVDTEIRECSKREKLEATLQKYDLGGCLLLSGMNGRQFGYEEIPSVKEVLYQKVLSDIDPESLLIRIVQEEDPMKYVRSKGSWEAR